MRVVQSLALCLVLCLLLLAGWAAAQNLAKMPDIEGENLAGQKVTLPQATKGEVAVLVFGFSRASKAPTSAWADKLNSEFGARSGFALYQLPVLEQVPRFIRGMVISGMKRNVGVSVREHFVPLLQREEELKKLVSYKEPDDAYLVILDRGGQIVQQWHGTLTDAAYARLHGELESLLNRRE